MSSREFSEWQAYFRLQPFGAQRDDLRIAVLDALMANINRDTKQKQTPFTAEDFLLRWDTSDADQPQQMDAMKELAISLAAAGFGTITTNGGAPSQL